MVKKYILGGNQGTTGTTTLVLGDDWNIIGRGYIEHTQFYPKTGWVEHDPIEIWEKTKASIRLAVEDASVRLNQVQALGIDNQGETVMIWNKATGEPVYNALVWQDKRTADAADN